LDPETLRKISFVSKDDFHLIQEIIPADQLEIAYGGKNDFKFNPENDWIKDYVLEPSE